MARLLAAVLLLTLTGGVTGLRCYRCVYEPGNSVSDNDPTCRDPFGGSVDTHTCEAYESCVKASSRNYPYGTYRVCYPTIQCLDSDGCVSANGQTTCCCNSDLCNGAGSVTASVVVLAALGFAVKLCAP